jgi:hypothetical protein
MMPVEMHRLTTSQRFALGRALQAQAEALALEDEARVGRARAGLHAIQGCDGSLRTTARALGADPEALSRDMSTWARAHHAYRPYVRRPKPQRHGKASWQERLALRHCALQGNESARLESQACLLRQRALTRALAQGVPSKALAHELGIGVRELREAARRPPLRP